MQEVLYILLLVVHVLVSVFLVVAVLMQRAKGGGLAGIAGGAASQAVFGGRGAATLLHKVTIGLAITFGVICLLLSILSKGMSSQRSVVQQELEANPLQEMLGTNPAVRQEPTTAPMQAPEGQATPPNPMNAPQEEQE